MCGSAPSWRNLQPQQVRLVVVQVPTCHQTGNAEEKKEKKKKQLPCVLWVCPNLEITRAQRGQRLNRISQQLSPAGELLPSTWMTAGESRIHQNPPFGLLSAGRIFQWNLDKSHHVEFGLKEEGGSPQSGAAATGEAFQFPPFSGLLRDHA